VNGSINLGSHAVASTQSQLSDASSNAVATVEFVKTAVSDLAAVGNSAGGALSNLLALTTALAGLGSNDITGIMNEITAEGVTARAAEHAITTLVTNEADRATAAELVLAGKVTAERLRAVPIEAGLRADVDQVMADLATETGRATHAENLVAAGLVTANADIAALQSTIVTLTAQVNTHDAALSALFSYFFKTPDFTSALPSHVVE